MIDNALEKACRIFFGLIRSGTLSRKDDRELVSYYADKDVQNALYVMTTESGVKIQEIEDGALMLFPIEPGSIFDMTDAQLREAFGVKLNVELYFCYFVILSLLAMFYSGENVNILTRESATLEEVVSFVDQKAKELEESDDLADFSEETEIRLNEMFSQWRKRLPVDPQSSLTRSSKMSFVKKTLSYLSEQGFVFVERDYIVRIQPKLTALIKGYYGAEERRLRVMAYLMKDRGTDHA